MSLILVPFSDKKGKVLLVTLGAISLIICIASIRFLKLGNELLDASEKGDTVKVKSLLETKINVDTKDWEKDTPLLLAIEGNHIETVRLLLQYKANVNVKNRFGTIPLSSAIKKGYIEIAVLLLEHGADITFAGTDVSAEWKNDNKFAIFVTEKGYTKILELLLNRGVSVNLRQYNDDTLLHLATRRGHTEVVALLLERGADINAEDALGLLPIHNAIFRKHIEIVRLLLKHRADPNSIGRFGDTPLHYAAEFGNAELAKFLLIKGVNINVVNFYGSTPLYKAAKNNHVEVFFILLIFGADLDERCMEMINDNLNLNNCLVEFERIREMTHLGKIIRGYKEGNSWVMLDYIDKNGKNRDSNMKQLIQEFQNIKRYCSSNEGLSFIPQYLLSVLKDMEQQYMLLSRKKLFKTGTLSGLIREVAFSHFGKEIVNVVSEYAASILSDQDTINLSLVCESINTEANRYVEAHYKKAEMKVKTLLTQLEGIISSENVSPNPHIRS
ncbi:ankyrin repeat domain-containing protein [Wolbachia endosymbiont of Cantharis cryptica]|uniref:ankyrin repeat domain-containing protein n=1 Tax=Wolbachia endosymbiont of Cantharis cryptica TaxID=3066132 RepID=UPI00376EEEF3